jgi:hypothetical protein
LRKESYLLDIGMGAGAGAGAFGQQEAARKVTAAAAMRYLMVCMLISVVGLKASARL